MFVENNGSRINIKHKVNTISLMDRILRPTISPSGAPGGVLPRLLSFVCQAMAIAQLTHLHISIPAWGAEECFPHDTPSHRLTDPHRVLFASGVTILNSKPSLKQSPDMLIHDPVCPDVTEVDGMDILDAEPDVPIPVLRPPPGFFGNFHGRGRSGGRTVTRLCLTFRRSSQAGFLGDIIRRAPRLVSLDQITTKNQP